MNRMNVLILDRERDIGELFARALETMKKYKCYYATNEEDAVALLKDMGFDLILADMSILSTGDFSLMRKIHRLCPGITIVAGAYNHQKEQITKALSYGAEAYFIKPIPIEELRKRIDDLNIKANSSIRPE
ncbi:MAG: response regulator [Pseudomonadota bacterium]